MSNFSILIITVDGLNQINDSITSKKQITFTKMAVSSHQYDSGELKTLKGIADVKQYADIRKTDISESDTITVDSIFSNESNELAEGYFIRTIGLYSKSNEESEILFAVAVEKTDNPSYMPAHGLTTTAIQIKFRIKLSNTENICITVDSAGMATIGDVLDVSNELRDSVKLINGTIKEVKDDAADMNAAITELREEKLDKTENAKGALAVAVPRVETDALTRPGSFTFVIKEHAPSSPNLPSAEWYHVITSEGGDSGYSTQLYIGMTTQRIFYRNKSQGTWNPLHEIPLMTNDVFRISGHIIANGYYSVRGGDKVKMWTDNEGGNFEITSDTGKTTWQIDALKDVLRIFCHNNETGENGFPLNISNGDGAAINVLYNTIFKSNLYRGSMYLDTYGNVRHKDSTSGQVWCVSASDGTPVFSVNYENGNLYVKKHATINNLGIFKDTFNNNNNRVYIGGKDAYEDTSTTIRIKPCLQLDQYENALCLGPTSNNGVELGSNITPFQSITARNIYNSSGLITSSDRNKKKDFADITQEFAASIIDGLVPTSFKYKDGNSGRTHYGLIAQDVEELLEELGIDNTDFAPLIKEYPTKEVENEDGSKTLVTDYDAEPEYFLRYEGFTGLIIKYIQGLKQENNDLKDKMSQLEDRLELLEGKINNI